MVNQYEIPEGVAAVDAHLMDGLSAERKLTLNSSSASSTRSTAPQRARHTSSSSSPTPRRGRKSTTSLATSKAADEMYPNKAGKVVKLVKEKSGLQFTGNDHIKAWRHYKVRPTTKAAHPENTNKEYCLYHQAHKDYTYSDAWGGQARRRHRRSDKARGNPRREGLVTTSPSAIDPRHSGAVCSSEWGLAAAVSTGRCARPALRQLRTLVVNTSNVVLWPEADWQLSASGKARADAPRDRCNGSN